MEIDSTYLQEVRTAPEYNYISEVDAEAKINANKGVGNLGNFIERNEGLFKFCSVLFLLIILIILIWQISKRFKWETDDGSTTPDGMGSDTIYDHNWHREIDTLMQEGKYSEAVVLCYLYWLNDLNTKGIITFHPSKTPGIFIEEVENYKFDDTNTDARKRHLDTTHSLTNHYLRIRYGHKEASKALAEELTKIIK